MPASDPSPVDWPIVALDGADLGAFTDLAAARGWGRTPSRWALTLEHAEVWGVRSADGRSLYGTVSLYRPPGGPAVVGGMLVAADQERQGLGEALLAHAVAAAPGGVGIVLYATPFGDALYRRAGFVDREVVHVHQGAGPPGAASAGARRRGMRVGPPEPAGLAVLAAVDAASGVGDRSALLADVAALAGAQVSIDKGETAAGLAWPTHEGNWSIGPVAATDEAGALGVVATLVEAARAAGAEQFRIDLATPQVGLRTWCSARGIGEIRTAPGLVLPAHPANPVDHPTEARRALITQGFG